MIKIIAAKEYNPEWHDTIEGILNRKRRNSNITFAGKSSKINLHLPNPANFTRTPNNIWIDSL